MKKYVFALFLFASFTAFAQNKNFIDQPYLETTAAADTLVSPDRIYLSIELTEKDTKGKISVEQLEKNMFERLSAIGINLDKQLFLTDLSSNFKKYFLQQTDVQKSKAYTLLTYDAQTACNAMVELEKLGIANVELDRTEYSKIEELKMELRSKAILKARRQGEAMTKPLGQKLGALIYVTDRQELVNNVSGMQVRRNSYKSVSVSGDHDKFIIEFEKIKVKIELHATFRIE